MSYEQEWARHQELRAEVARKNEALRAAEAELNAAKSQSVEPDGRKQDTAPLEANVNRLREEKAAAETEVGKFQMEVAQADPAHAQWLDEGIPPAQGQKTELEPKTIEAVASTLAPMAESASPIAGAALGSLNGPAAEALAYAVNHGKEALDYAAGYVRTKLPDDPKASPSPEGPKDDPKPGSPSEGPKVEAQVKWENDIAQQEQKLQETHQRQMEALDRNRVMLEIQQEDAKKFPDADKKLEQLKPMDETLKREEEKLNKNLNEGQEAIERHREALQKAMDETRHLQEAERQAEIERQRELAWQREIERQRQLEEQNRSR